MKWTQEEMVFLREEFPNSTTKDVLSRLNDRFGNGRTIYALNIKANKMGLKKTAVADDNRNRRCARVIRWGKEPELDGILLELDTGSVSAAQDRFEDRTGIKLTRCQVYEHRRRHGKLSRTVDLDKPYAGGRRVPIGTETMTKDGVKVKVRERSVVPGAKDNWRMKKDVVWEDANGRSLPDGMCVVHADRDICNYEPDNLVAVEKRLLGIINGQFGEWDSRETLELAVAMAKLAVRSRDVQLQPRTCAACGRVFAPDRRHQTDIKNCPECVKSKRHIRSGNKKAVRCIETGEVFESVTAAARSRGGTMQTLSAALSRMGGKWHGETWEKVV